MPLALVRSLLLALALAVATTCWQTEALNVKLSGVNYDLRRGPDWDTQRCKSSNVVANDLKKLKQLTNRIRIYSLDDCNVRSVLRSARDQNMTVWLGMWVSDSPTRFRKELYELRLLIDEELVTEELVEGINVGSEALYRKDTTAETLIENYKSVKETLTKANLNITLSVTDTLGELVNNPELLETVDLISFNQFPFWNNIKIEDAVADLEASVDSLINATNSKPFVIAETGWAAGGFDERASDATPENAAQYLKEFFLLAEEREWKYYYFVGFDAPFLKTSNGSDDSVEAYFGLFNSSGKLNTHFADLTIPAKKMLDGEFDPMETKAPTPAPTDAAPGLVSVAPVVLVLSTLLAAFVA